MNTTETNRVVLSSSTDRTGRIEWSMTVHEGDEATEIALPDAAGQSLRPAYRAAEAYLADDGYEVTRWHVMTGYLTTTD